ncbi:hypothetical protein ASPVEDRAFT_339759 [Aspergillus versicolor CBS 583.65]|uniref:Uncharacterized protein n=1 Tax=Aspergillus versicolor CBS 583.65 TaxID=1036611 RepID=A0A1L9PZ93_ASPVE|nr:uncharacterized protein ASPVEDRAFT_339759 [Aspergillus versicolor CBS 583.65]OJJ06848.1 hypothetical protein ASPVEDRAFT_339759 [Aspergillus versicolor CBS 583.65]
MCRGVFPANVAVIYLSILNKTINLFLMYIIIHAQGLSDRIRTFRRFGDYISLGVYVLALEDSVALPQNVHLTAKKPRHTRGPFVICAPTAVRCLSYLAPPALFICPRSPHPV